MKYPISLLMISALIISSFTFYDAYAANTLSFDYTKIVLEHSSGVSCLQCTVTGNTLSVTLKSSGNTDLTITLTRATGTNDFFSPWIAFTATGTTGNTTFVTSANHVISATTTTSGISPAPPATIYQNWTSLLANSSLYARNRAIISPNDANICTSNGGDTDGDGICNNWENGPFPAGTICSGKQGLCIRTSPTAPIYFLECNTSDATWHNMCPSPTKADLYYEIDWMTGHRPRDSDLDKIYTTFYTSPYTSINGISGITLHIQLDDELPHVNVISSSGNSVVPGFDQLKYWWFGTYTDRRNVSLPVNFETNAWMTGIRSQKAQVFHYVIFAHSQQGNTGSSGVAEMPGNDVMISLGSFDGKVGNQDQQQGTLLHEIGHNLGLDHGGLDGINCKPNYLSVMSYSRQFSDLVNRTLDYSHSQLNTLNENAGLSEPTGITASLPTGLKTVYGPPASIVITTGSAINWNRDTNPSDTTDTGVTMDINNMGTTGCPAIAGQTLFGFNDWGSPLKLFDHGGTGSSNGTGPNSSNTSDTRPEPIIDTSNHSPHISLVKENTSEYNAIKKVEYTTHSGESINVAQDKDGLESSVIEKNPYNPTGGNDGLQAPLIYKELTSDDVTLMRNERIESLFYYLEEIPDGEFTHNVKDMRTLYQDELGEIKRDINSKNNDNSMFDAYSKMLTFQSRFDGDGDNEILKTNSPYLNSTQTLIADIIDSQSKALPEFSTLSIFVLALVFASIVIFSRKQSGFSSKLGYANF